MTMTGRLTKADDAHPLPGHVYRSKEDGTIWSFEAFWAHPKHRPYHVGWTGEYAIVQVYGNFKNEVRVIELAKWHELFELAWEPMRVCKFCGFTRMRPCEVRQTCANLTDAPLEPDDVHDEPEATPEPGPVPVGASTAANPNLPTALLQGEPD